MTNNDIVPNKGILQERQAPMPQVPDFKEDTQIIIKQLESFKRNPSGTFT